MTFSTISAIDYNGRSISTRNCLMPEGPVINYREDQGGGGGQKGGGGGQVLPSQKGDRFSHAERKGGTRSVEEVLKSEPRDIL